MRVVVRSLLPAHNQTPARTFKIYSSLLELIFGTLERTQKPYLSNVTKRVWQHVLYRRGFADINNMKRIPLYRDHHGKSVEIYKYVNTMLIVN